MHARPKAEPRSASRKLGGGNEVLSACPPPPSMTSPLALDLSPPATSFVCARGSEEAPAAAEACDAAVASAAPLPCLFFVLLEFLRWSLRTLPLASS